MFPFGYCTNVHAAAAIAEIENALTVHAVAIKTAISPHDTMPIGLWLNEMSLAELNNAAACQNFSAWLQSQGLVPKTLNGFPQGDFHQSVVKHRVYKPTWAERARLQYTCQLAETHAVLLGHGAAGTISTLPLGWIGQPDSAAFRAACIENLLKFTEFADSLESRTQFHSRLCLEPEPGCYLGNSHDLRVFLDHLISRLTLSERQRAQRYLGICHDVCHAAVMFEDQAVELPAFAALGFMVAKVQISSALIADFSLFESTVERSQLANELKKFAEPKYLHQTMIDGEDFFEDLPLAIERHLPIGEWRVHFHVPIFATELACGLGTTQKEIERCLHLLGPSRDEIDWEIETYAWPVLPTTNANRSLAEGIEQEFRWLSQKFTN